MMDLAKVEANARKYIGSVTPANPSKAFMGGGRSEAGRSLPPYYLVYFLLVKLLKFKDMGRFEKVSFSIPVECDGVVAMIEYRKFGLGIFIRNKTDEVIAEKVAKHIRAAVKAAEPYFESLADTVAKGSDLNVKNNTIALFERYEYFANCYDAKVAEAEARKGERVEIEMPLRDGVASAKSFSFPSYALRQEAVWNATAAIEAFFSWTEHVFILAAILNGEISTGEDVAKVAGTEWKEKFQLTLDISDPENKKFYDQLTALRSQVRNFVAHGAFGKDGQALSFHSEVGAVPLRLPHRAGKDRFRFGNGVDVVPPEAMALMRSFIDTIWNRKLAIEKIYLESALPLILSMVTNGEYTRAMSSEQEMQHLVNFLGHQFDNAANMDW